MLIEELVKKENTDTGEGKEEKINNFYGEEKINNAIKYAKELTPLNIFEEMLAKVKPEEHGFSEKRISELREKANSLQGQILMEGTKNIF